MVSENATTTPLPSAISPASIIVATDRVPEISAREVAYGQNLSKYDGNQVSKSVIFPNGPLKIGWPLAETAVVTTPDSVPTVSISNGASIESLMAAKSPEFSARSNAEPPFVTKLCNAVCSAAVNGVIETPETVADATE